MELLCHLLPDQTQLQLENWRIDETQATIGLIVSSTQAIAQCPVCSFSTHRIHSRYERYAADLPWADYSITLQLRVRKFFCINPLCKRRIFTERLASVTAPWARRTLRMAQRLTEERQRAEGRRQKVRNFEKLSATGFQAPKFIYATKKTCISRCIAQEILRPYFKPLTLVMGISFCPLPSALPPLAA